MHDPDAFMSAADNILVFLADGSRRERPGYAVNCWLGKYKSPTHLSRESKCLAIVVQSLHSRYGSLMLESDPETTISSACVKGGGQATPLSTACV